MGKYINQNSKGESLGASFREKTSRLMEDGAERILTPTEWSEGLVCVVDNGLFAAAAYAYDEREMNLFADEIIRPTQWFSYSHAKTLAD